MTAPAPVRTEFSLRSLTREVWAELDSADAHVLAKEIARRVPRSQREAALAEALTEYARVFITNQRPSGYSGSPAAGAGQRNSGRSAKVAAIRRTWPQLRATYLTAAGQKPLVDCSKADVIFIADHLDRKAAECAAKSAWMRDLSAALAAHKALRVGDLPDDVLAGFLTGAAA